MRVNGDKCITDIFFLRWSLMSNELIAKILEDYELGNNRVHYDIMWRFNEKENTKLLIRNIKSVFQIYDVISDSDEDFRKKDHIREKKVKLIINVNVT